MELLIIIVYAAILAGVAPFVLPKSDHYGKLVPVGIALTFGSVLWLLLTWLGFRYEEAWIWFIVMLTMPIATWAGTSYILKNREAEEAKKLAELRLSGKA